MQNQNSSKPSAGGNATKKKGRNKPEELLVITKAKDLVKHSFILTSNTKRYPKKYRFTLVNRIQDKAMLVYECLVEANELNLSIPGAGVSPAKGCALLCVECPQRAECQLRRQSEQQQCLQWQQGPSSRSDGRCD